MIGWIIWGMGWCNYLLALPGGGEKAAGHGGAKLNEMRRPDWGWIGWILDWTWKVVGEYDEVGELGVAPYILFYPFCAAHIWQPSMRIKKEEMRLLGEGGGVGIR
jgi:hypothetical protein